MRRSRRNSSFVWSFISTALSTHPHPPLPQRRHQKVESTPMPPIEFTTPWPLVIWFEFDRCCWCPTDQITPGTCIDSPPYHWLWRKPNVGLPIMTEPLDSHRYLWSTLCNALKMNNPQFLIKIYSIQHQTFHHWLTSDMFTSNSQIPMTRAGTWSNKRQVISWNMSSSGVVEFLVNLWE